MRLPSSEQVLARLGWKDALSGLLQQSRLLSMWRRLGGLPFMPRGNPVFMVHKIAVEPDPFFPALPLESFDALVRVLTRHYRLISFGEMAHRLHDGTTGPRDACLTFDDGYRETHRLAEPVLRRHGGLATTFIVTAGLEGAPLRFDQLAHALQRTSQRAIAAPDGRTLPLTTIPQRLSALACWKDALRKQPDRDRRRTMRDLLGELRATARLPERSTLLSLADLGAMARSSDVWDIGSHTVHHVSLDVETPASCERELCDSRRVLENAAQREVTTLAYPHGSFSDHLPPILKRAGYRAAAIDKVGGNYPGTDPFRVQRTTAYWPTSARIELGVEREFYRRPASALGSAPSLGAFVGRDAVQVHAAGIL